MNHSQPIVRAIDVGYGITKFTLGGPRGAAKCMHFPSRAYFTVGDQSGLELGGPRKTVAIPLQGIFYEVGPEINLTADAVPATHGHDRYVETPEYLALMRGALRYMNVPHIDVLVVGLPVSLFASKRQALERLASGRHEVEPGRFVTVGKALVLAQPQGALVTYAHQAKRMGEIAHEHSLVLDPGYRTFDWLTSQGMRLVKERSGSINLSMLDISKLMCKQVSKDLNVDYQDRDALDLALRTGLSPMICQKPYDLTALRSIATMTVNRAVSQMVESYGKALDIQNIILVGGSSFLFKKAIKEAFPSHNIHEVKEPMYANVRGYDAAGQDYAETMQRRAAKQRPGLTDANPLPAAPADPIQEQI